MATPSAPTVTKPTSADAIRRLDSIANAAMEVYGRAASAGSIEKAFMIAQAMNDLRDALTPEVMAPIMSLMNSNTGFRTDRDPTRSNKPVTPYGLDVVREVCVEAFLRGFLPAGNEFNIISGGFYAAKNGLHRKVTTFPGVTHVKMMIGVPKTMAGGAIVPCKATWSLNGVADSLECDIPTKVNEYMGADAIIGKATRKLLARVHDQLTGTNTPEAEVGDDPPLLAPATPSAPLFAGQTPQTATQEDKTPPGPVSEQPKAAPSPTPASNVSKQKAIVALGVKMTADNIGIDQVISFLRSSGWMHPDATTIEEAPTSKLLQLLATWDANKAAMAEIMI